MSVRWWSEEEAELLKELWVNPKVTKEDYIRVFPSRSWGAIEHKAKRMQLGPRKSPSTIDYEYLKKLREVIEG